MSTNKGEGQGEVQNRSISKLEWTVVWSHTGNMSMMSKKLADDQLRSWKKVHGVGGHEAMKSKEQDHMSTAYKRLVEGGNHGFAISRS